MSESKEVHTSPEEVLGDHLDVAEEAVSSGFGVFSTPGSSDTDDEKDDEDEKK